MDAHAQVWGMTKVFAPRFSVPQEPSDGMQHRNGNILLALRYPFA
jgi:hypothetical protein